MESNATRKSETQLRRVAEVGRANRGEKKTIAVTTVVYNYLHHCYTHCYTTDVIYLLHAGINRRIFFNQRFIFNQVNYQKELEKIKHLTWGN